jgi:hypothetical protein
MKIQPFFVQQLNERKAISLIKNKLSAINFTGVMLYIFLITA